MIYKVIKFFTDLQDDNRAYNVGDIFPHENASYPVSEKRIAELASGENLQGVPLIQLVEEAVKTEPKKPAKKKAKKTAEE